MCACVRVCVYEFEVEFVVIEVQKIKKWWSLGRFKLCVKSYPVYGVRDKNFTFFSRCNI